MFFATLLYFDRSLSCVSINRQRDGAINHPVEDFVYVAGNVYSICLRRYDLDHSSGGQTLIGHKLIQGCEIVSGDARIGIAFGDCRQRIALPLTRLARLLWGLLLSG